MSGIGPIGRVGTTPPDLNGLRAGGQKPLRHVVAFKVNYSDGSSDKFCISPERDSAQKTRQTGQAAQASSGLVRAMHVLAGAGGTVGAGGLAVGKAFAHYPVAVTTGALFLGRLMHQWGLPNLPAAFVANVAQAGGQQMLNAAQEGGKQVVGALATTLTSKEGLGVVGGGGLLLALRNALRNPGAARQKLTQFGTGLVFAVLTAVPALQQRLNRHP